MKTEKQRLIEQMKYHTLKLQRVNRKLERINDEPESLISSEMIEQMPFDQPFTTRKLRALSYGWRKFIEGTTPEVKVIECDKHNIQIEQHLTPNNVKAVQFIRRQF